MSVTIGLIIAVFIGLIPAAIAQNKGYSFGLWWFLGFAFFIVALPAALLLPINAAAVKPNKMN